MPNHIYKKIELVGSSKNTIEEAIENAVTTAAESLHNLRWFEVSEIRGHINEGVVEHWQVGVKIGFTLDQKPEQ